MLNVKLVNKDAVNVLLYMITVQLVLLDLFYITILVSKIVVTDITQYIPIM